MFDNRIYRKQHKKKGLVSFDITVKQTNLNIQSDTDLTDKAIQSVLMHRNIIETHIKFHPDFAHTLVPVTDTSPAPGIIMDMIKAGKSANVGPMAAVAGAVAEYTGKSLLEHTSEVVVENGGDIFVKSDCETIFTVYAENSPLSMTCGLRVKKRNKPYGICTSSGTLGHSKSFGKADAVTVLSDSCPLADAAATTVCNRVQKKTDIQTAIDAVKAIPGVQAVVIIKGEHIGLWGELELVRLPV